MRAQDHTPVSRRSADLDVTAALTSTDGPLSVVVVDSTGLRMFGQGEGPLDKQGGQARRSWRKRHVAVDPDRGDILASALTSKEEEDDASLVRSPIDQTTRPIGTVLTDGAGEPVYRALTAPAPTWR